MVYPVESCYVEACAVTKKAKIQEGLGGFSSPSACFGRTAAYVDIYILNRLIGLRQLRLAFWLPGKFWVPTDMGYSVSNVLLGASLSLVHTSRFLL